MIPEDSCYYIRLRALALAEDLLPWEPSPTRRRGW